MGAVRVDPSIVGVVTDIAVRAEQRGDDLAVETARFLLGICLAQQSGPDRQRGLKLLAYRTRSRDAKPSDRGRRTMSDIEFAKEAARNGDTDGAIKMLSSLSGGDAMPRGVRILVGGGDGGNPGRARETI